MIRAGAGWHLLLADLTLILFLFALAALDDVKDEHSASLPPVAPAQALYRPGPDAPSLGEWLAERPADPRATVTIFARHSGDDEARIWARARNLAREAGAGDHGVRVVVTRGASSDVYASLAYDAPAAPIPAAR